MHLKSFRLCPEDYPTTDYYPFNLPIFSDTVEIELDKPVTFFIGENGSGKSTLLTGLTQKCGIHIWQESDRPRFDKSPYEDQLQQAISLQWVNGRVPGSFFSSQIFQCFSQILDEWAVADSRILNRFGGHSLMSLSHGQSLMSYFNSRYQVKGIYFLDEPETALSPRSQLELMRVITRMGNAGHAQFIIATHSPILLACPVAQIFNFNTKPLRQIPYQQTEYFTFYYDFMKQYEKYLKGLI